MRFYGQLIAFLPLFLCASLLGARTVLASTTGFVYLLGELHDSEVYQFRQDTDGQIHVMPPPHFEAGGLMPSAAITPSGKYLYLLNNGNSAISELRIDKDGHLAPLRKKAITAPQGDKLVVCPNGRCLYEVNTEDASIFLYRIDSDGQLRSLPYTTKTEKFPLSMTFDSTGNFAYVLGRISGNTQAGINWIAGYRVNKNGNLTPLKALNIDAGYWSFQIFASTSKPYIFLPCRDGLTKYRVSITGQLVNPVTTLKETSDSQASGILDEQLGYIISTAAKDSSRSFPDELVITKVENGGNLTVKNTYTMDSTGTLKYGGDQYNRWQHPMAAFASLVLDPQKQILYAIDAQSFKIFRYQINADGTIAELFPPAVTGHAPNQPASPQITIPFDYADACSNYLFFVPKK